MREGGSLGCCRMAVSSWTLPDSLTCHSLSSADYGTTISRLEMWPICPVVGVHVPPPHAKIASHKCLERLNPERSLTASAALPCHRSLGHYPNSKKPSTCCSAACSSSEHCAAAECLPSPDKEVSTPSEVDRFIMVQRYFLRPVEIRVRFSRWAARGLASTWGALPASSHDRTRRHGGGCLMNWGGITIPGRTELHICQGMSLGSTTETMPSSLLLFPTPNGTGMHSSFKTAMQESLVRNFVAAPWNGIGDGNNRAHRRCECSARRRRAFIN